MAAVNAWRHGSDPGFDARVDSGAAIWVFPEVLPGAQSGARPDGWLVREHRDGARPVKKLLLVER